jgi:HSP20 family protein
MMLIKKNSTSPTTLPKLFDDLISRNLQALESFNLTNNGSTIPAANVLENNEAFIVEMVVPGMDKKDIQVQLDHETLHVSFDEKKGKQMPEDVQYIRREFNYQSFHRSFYLPKNTVDTTGIQAKFNDGILRVFLPKKEEVKKQSSRVIPIK